MTLQLNQTDEARFIQPALKFNPFRVVVMHLSFPVGYTHGYSNLTHSGFSSGKSPKDLNLNNLR